MPPSMETKTTFTYDMIFLMMLRMGFLQDSKSPGPSQNYLAEEIFTILRGDQFS